MNRQDQVKQLEKEWAESPRWKGVERGYTAADVVKLRGTVQIEHTLARRGSEKLWELVNQEDPCCALGALTGNQAIQEIQAGLKAIYCSGWQVAGDGNSAGEMYPDQSLYPVDSVPKMVERINNAFIRTDEIHSLNDDESTFRRQSERLRAHEEPDPRRRIRRAFRRPAFVGQEVWSHGRQGTGADTRSCEQAECGAPGG
jgi:isocitrate lyase